MSLLKQLPPNPTDAFKCFMSNELDFLVIGNCILKKEEQYYLNNDFNSDFIQDL